MSVLKTSPDLKEIIKKAVERIGEDHAKSRDHKNDYHGITLKNEDLVIEEALKEAANEMAEKMVLENTIDGMVKNISEDLTRTPVQGRVPGLDVYEKSIKKSKTDTDAHLKATKKKFEDYADFENNSKPEFPHQNNSKTADADGQFQYYRNDDEQEEYIDDNRGMGLQDANGAVDLEKISDYLDGSSTTGNAQVDADGNALGNVTKSDLGKKIEKTAIRKKKKNDDALNSMSNDRRYSPNVQKVKTVKEDVAIDMENMKKLWAYNKKTQ